MKVSEYAHAREVDELRRLREAVKRLQDDQDREYRNQRKGYPGFD